MWIQDGLLRVVTSRHGRRTTTSPLPPDRWIDATIDRHMRHLTPSEFLKAVRALSVRYVERRGELPTRSPIDSPGKRAAFAGFFAPLHYLAVRAVVRAVNAADQPLSHLLDLGCGTGVASAAWCSELSAKPFITGIDRTAWALEEARWNWDALGIPGTTRLQSLVEAVNRFKDGRPHAKVAHAGLVLAWSVNELTADDRDRLLPLLLESHSFGASILVLEPLAQAAATWWDEWARPFVSAGGRADEWKFSPNMPPRLAELDRAAGFRRSHLSVRSLWLAGKPASS